MAFGKKNKQEKIGKHGRSETAQNTKKKKTKPAQDFENDNFESETDGAASAGSTTQMPNVANAAGAWGADAQVDTAGAWSANASSFQAASAGVGNFQAANPSIEYATNFNSGKKHVGKTLAIVFGVIVGVLLVIYLVGALMFSNKLFPNTKLNDEDVSLISTEELAKKLNTAADNYKLQVTGSNGYTQTITAKDIDLKNAAGTTMDTMVPNHNAWGWPVEVFKTHDITDGAITSYNADTLTNLVNTAVDTFNATAIQPVNANIAYDSKAATFNITKETVGTALNKDAVLSAVTKSVNGLDEKLTLDTTYLLQPTLLSSDSRLQASVQNAQKMCKTNVTYTVGDVKAATLDVSVLAPMIEIDAECNTTLNSDKLNEWASGISGKLNTVGSTRTYTRPDGKQITVSGGAYGWILNEEAFENQVRTDAAEGAVKTVAIEFEQSGTGFTALGGADWGKRYVDVDLTEQHVRFYDDSGNIIWEADCVSGAPTDNHATPTGVWYVNAKESPSKLIGYTSSGQKEYETQVQFWMPFEGNGVGFHDATWQSAFGGTRYQDGYGSHGCINLSYEKAESLYGIIKTNDVVIVHN